MLNTVVGDHTIALIQRGTYRLLPLRKKKSCQSVNWFVANEFVVTGSRLKGRPERNRLAYEESFPSIVDDGLFMVSFVLQVESKGI